MRTDHGPELFSAPFLVRPLDNLVSLQMTLQTSWTALEGLACSIINYANALGRNDLQPLGNYSQTEQ